MRPYVPDLKPQCVRTQLVDFLARKTAQYLALNNMNILEYLQQNNIIIIVDDLIDECLYYNSNTDECFVFANSIDEMKALETVACLELRYHKIYNDEIKEIFAEEINMFVKNFNSCLEELSCAI